MFFGSGTVSEYRTGMALDRMLQAKIRVKRLKEEYEEKHEKWLVYIKKSQPVVNREIGNICSNIFIRNLASFQHFLRQILVDVHKKDQNCRILENHRLLIKTYSELKNTANHYEAFILIKKFTDQFDTRITISEYFFNVMILKQIIENYEEKSDGNSHGVKLENQIKKLCEAYRFLGSYSKWHVDFFMHLLKNHMLAYQETTEKISAMTDLPKNVVSLIVSYGLPYNDKSAFQETIPGLTA